MKNQKTKLLVVDDEVNILKSVRRLLSTRNQLSSNEWETAFATSAAEALEKFKENNFHVIVSDQRMPGMQGVQLLDKVAGEYPDTIRILLTGYIDIDSAVNAINVGKVFAYLKKPIDNDDFIMQLDTASDFYWLKQQNKEFHQEIKEKNEILNMLIHDLEDRVKERTKLLIERNQQLCKATKLLKSSIDNLIMVALGFLELSNPGVAQHSKRVAKICEKFSKKLNLSEENDAILQKSAFLHDIGKIGLPEAVANKPFNRITLSKERELITFHPEYGVSLIKEVEELKPVAAQILSHHENFDGSGYPNGLKSDQIPFLARVLAIANALDIITNPQDKKYFVSKTKDSIKAYFKKYSGVVFDPSLVSELLDLDILSEEKPDESERIVSVSATSLTVGMKLAANVMTKSRLLILPKGEILDTIKIKRIKNFYCSYGIAEDLVKVFMED